MKSHFYFVFDNVTVTQGKLDWSTAGHGESMTHIDLALWAMYTDFPYDIPNHGGWHSEITGGGCAASGTVHAGGTNHSTKSVYSGDWGVAKANSAYLESRTSSDPPFFVYQGFNIVHPPYETNQYWMNKIDPNKIDVPVWPPLESLHPCDLQSSMLKGCIPAGGNTSKAAVAFYDPARRRRLRQIYLAMIAEFDAMVGLYMQSLETSAKDAWDNTIWIVTSDHGDMQMEHQQFYKMTPYDASSSVPMVMFHGGAEGAIKAHGRFTGSTVVGAAAASSGGGVVVRSPTQLIDIFPTIMDLANIAAADRPSGLDGASLATYLPSSMRRSARAQLTAASTSTSTSTKNGVVRGGGVQGLDNPPPQFIVSQFHGKNIAMSWYFVVQNYNQSSTYKYLVWGTGAEVPSLLFNLDADPSEQTNLIATDAGKVAFKDVVAELDKSLKSVVDYPTLSQTVARYNRAIFATYIANLTSAGTDWKAFVSKQAYWQQSWNVNATASLSAVENWINAEDALVKPCRATMVAELPAINAD